MVLFKLDFRMQLLQWEYELEYIVHSLPQPKDIILPRTLHFNGSFLLCTFFGVHRTSLDLSRVRAASRHKKQVGERGRAIGVGVCARHCNDTYVMCTDRR